MPRTARHEVSTPPLPVITETITKTIEQKPMPAPEPEPDKRPSIDDFLAGVPRDEWTVNHAFYLYRLNEKIEIVEKTQDERYRGTFLRHLTPQDIQEFPQGPFWFALQTWTKQRYGGSSYRVIINYTKEQGTTLYNKLFSIEGDPVLDKREGWKNGGGPASSPADQSQFATMLVNMLKDQLEKLQPKESGGSLETAMQAVSQVQKNALEIARQQMPAPSSPAEMITAMMSIFEKMNAGRPQTSETDTLLKTISVLKEMGLINSQREQGGFSTVKEVVLGLKELGIKVGSSVAGIQEDWKLEVAKSLPEVGSAISRIVDRVVESRTAPIIAARMAPAGIGRPAMAPQVAAMPPGAPAMPGAAPLAGGPQPAGPPAQAETGMILWTWLRQRIVDWIQHDVEGDDAALAIHLADPQLAAMIEQQTPENLTEFLVKDPIMSVVKDDPRLPKFVAAMLDYFKDEEAQSDEGNLSTKPN